MNEGKNLRDILKRDAYLPLRKYLTSRLLELQNIENIKEVEGSEEQAVEVKSQKRAFLKLKEILEDLMVIEFSSKLEKGTKDSYSAIEES